jgi:tol-pal system protein YbgF
MTFSHAAILAAGVCAALAAPAAAQSREQRQMMADIRILQEQSQTLQNLINQLNEALKTVNARLDEQANANRKAFADQKLTIDTLSSDLRVVREKVDDNNVRIGSLTLELESLRRMVQQVGTAPVSTEASKDAPVTTEPVAGGAPDAAPAPSGPPALGTSPQRAWDTAWSDYTAGQYDLAVLGFEAYIRDFPTSDQADDAQVFIGKALQLDGKCEQALLAFEKAIRSYPGGNKVPDAYFESGVCLQNLGQIDKARDAFNTVVKDHPESDAARLAKQRLPQLPKSD